MTKQDLVQAFFERAVKAGVDLTKEDAFKLVDAFLDAVVDVLGKDGVLKLRGFGNFEVRVRASRRVVNPRTKQIITVPPSKTVKFKPSPNLVKAIL